MNKALYLVAFVAGAAIGGLATWQVLKKEYEKREQEAVDSVKEAYCKRLDEIDAEEAQQDAEEVAELLAEAYDQEEMTPERKEALSKIIKDKPDIKEYKKMLDKKNYTNYAKMKEEVIPEMPSPEVVEDKPYVITPEEFGEIEEYEKVSLIYFADEYLTDDDYNIIDDIPGTVTYDAFNHFGEYEDDSVFVRNDRLQCDYEILKDLRNFATDVM